MANNNGQTWVKAIARVANALGVLLPARKALKFGDGFTVTDVPDESLKGPGGDGEAKGFSFVQTVSALVSLVGSDWIDIDPADPAHPVIALDPPPTKDATASTIPLRDSHGAIENITSQWLSGGGDALDPTKATILFVDTKTATATGGQTTGFVSYMVQLRGWNGTASQTYTGSIAAFFDGVGVKWAFLNDDGPRLSISGSGDLDAKGGISCANDITTESNVVASTGLFKGNIAGTPATIGDLCFDGDGNPIWYRQSAAAIKTGVARGDIKLAGSWSAGNKGIPTADQPYEAVFYRNSTASTQTVDFLIINPGPTAIPMDAVNVVTIEIVKRNAAGTDGIGGHAVGTYVTLAGDNNGAGILPAYVDILHNGPWTLPTGWSLWVRITKAVAGTAIGAGASVSAGISE